MPTRKQPERSEWKSCPFYWLWVPSPATIHPFRVNIYSTFDILIAHYTTPSKRFLHALGCTNSHYYTHARLPLRVSGGLLVRKRDLPDTSHVCDSIQFAHLHGALLCSNIAKHINDATIHLCHTMCPLPALLLTNELFLACMKFIIGPSPFLRILVFWRLLEEFAHNQCNTGGVFNVFDALG